MRYCQDCEKEFKTEDAIIVKDVIEGFAIYPNKREKIKIVNMYCPNCESTRHFGILQKS